MATSGNFEKAITNWLKLRVEWVENSQDIANNKSNLTVTAYLVSTASNGRITASAKKSISLTINGTTYTKSDVIPNLSGAVKKQLFSKTVNVTHNADGTKACSISCTFDIKVTLSGTYYKTASTSGTATLDTIPRASQPSCITYPTTTKNVGDIGSSFRIHMNRASDTFTHYVYCKWYNKTVEIGDDVTNNIDWTIPANFADDIPNNTVGGGTIYVDTYSGNSKIGTASVSFTANVPSSVKPSISALTVADADTAIKNKFGVYVQTKSKAKVTITAAGSYSSTIKSYTTTLTNGSSVLTYNGASFTSNFLSFSGTYTVKTVVTDSRGRTAEKSTTISVAEYHPPQLPSLTTTRRNVYGEQDDEGTAVSLSFVWDIASVNNKNDKQYKMEYREEGATTWTVYGTKVITSTKWKDNAQTTFTTQFSADKAYEIRVTLSDYFSSSTKTARVATARTIFDVLADGTGICFGGVASKSNTCEIVMKTELKGGVACECLASGAWYMHANQEITLSQPISEQPTGVVFVFSRYDNTTNPTKPIDDDFTSHFVPKNLVVSKLDKGHSFIMSDAFFRNVGAKYIVIGDTVIKGHAANEEIYTASGITFNNKNWVLRYVIGV